MLRKLPATASRWWRAAPFCGQAAPERTMPPPRRTLTSSAAQASRKGARMRTRLKRAASGAASPSLPLAPVTRRGSERLAQRQADTATASSSGPPSRMEAARQAARGCRSRRWRWRCQCRRPHARASVRTSPQATDWRDRPRGASAKAEAACSSSASTCERWSHCAISGQGSWKRSGRGDEKKEKAR